MRSVTMRTPFLFLLLLGLLMRGVPAEQKEEEEKPKEGEKEVDVKQEGEVQEKKTEEKESESSESSEESSEEEGEEEDDDDEEEDDDDEEDEDEDDVDETVSKEEKLKIKELLELEDCGIRSAEGDTIHWKYRGTFLDGNEFDSGTFSATLGAGHVITGVDYGMRGLCVGEKRRMTMHSDWGYGDHGTRGIPGGATLVFEVEMLSIDRPNHSEL